MADSRPALSLDDDSPAPRRARRHRARRWTKRVLGLVVCLVGLLWLAHTPVVREWALGRLASWLATSHGLTIDAAGLEYDLLTLTASLDEARVATAAAPSSPVVHLRRVTAVFAPAALRGRLELRSLEADDVAVSIRGSGGSVPSRPFSMPAFSVGRLDVRRLSVEYRSADGSHHVEVRDGTLTMDGLGPQQAAGPFTVETIVFENGTARIRTGRMTGTARIDGDAVVLMPRSVIAGRETVTFEGEVALTGPDAGYRIGAEGPISFETLNAWFPAFPVGNGTIDARARLTGRLANPRTELELDTDTLTWTGIALPPATAKAVLSRDGIDVERLEASLGGARLVASGRVGFESTGLSAVGLTWSGVSSRHVAAVLRRKWSLAPDLTSGGSASFTWSGFVPELAAIGGTVAARVSDDSGQASAALNASASSGRWDVRATQELAGDTRARLEAVLVVDAQRPVASAVSGTVWFSSEEVGLALAQWQSLGLPGVQLPAALGPLPLTLEAGLAGSLGNPRLAGTASSAALRLAGAGTLTADATFTATRDGLTIDRFRAVDERGSTFGARGSLVFANGETAGAASLRRFDMGQITALLPHGWAADGMVDAEGTWSGTLNNPAAALRVTSRELAVNRASIGPIDATITVADGMLRLEGRMPGLAASVTGRLGLSDPFPFDVTTALDAADVGRLSRFVPATARASQAAGTVTAVATASGTLLSREGLSAALRLEHLDAQLNGHPLVLVAPAALRMTGSDISVDRLSLQSRDATLLVDGRLDQSGGGTLSATLDTPAAELVRWAAWAAPSRRIAADGRVRVEIRASGPTASVSLDGRASFALDRLQIDERTWAEGVRAEITLNDSTIEAARLTGTVLDGPLEVAASMPTAWLAKYLPAALAASRAAPGFAQLRGRMSAPASALLALFGGKAADQASGSVSVTVEATSSRATLGAVEAVATISDSGVVLGGVPFSLVRPAILKLQNSRLEIERAEFRDRSSNFSLGGSADLENEWDVDVRLTASGPLAFLTAILPGRTSGNFAADFSVSGPRGARTASGTVVLDRAALVIPAYRLALTDWSGRIDLTSDALVPVELAGQLNGGEAQFRGRLPLAPDAPEASTLTLSVRDAFLEVVRGFKSQADADLRLVRSGPDVGIDGSVTVINGAYREPITAMAALFSSEGIAGRAGELQRGAFDRVALDVRLNAENPIIIENSLGRVDLVPDLRLVGTLAEPALAGSLNALDGGRLTLAGRTYRILESQLRFSPRDGLQPRVNLLSETRVGEYAISLRVLGPVTALETTATSMPPLSDRDLRSLIVTGRTADRPDSGDEQFAMEALSSEILGFAGQMVGLDSLQLGRADFDIGASDVNPATRLTVTKSLNPWIRIIVSENLDDNRLTWIIVADSGRGYELRFSQRDNREEVIEFRHELQFGPGTTAGGVSRRAIRPVPKPVVSSVVFSGAPPVSARVLQDSIKVRTGTPFEVEQWQRDRERLEAVFRERGFATARVTPRRAVVDTPAGQRIDVEYNIEAGPRTVLDIVGVSLPAEAVANLRRAWSAAVLPEFFRDEVVRIVRHHLAGKNQLQPVVDVEFDEPAADTVRALVRVTPGPRVDAKRLIFEGNRAVTEQAIRSAVQRGVLDGAWVDSAPLIDAVTAWYRGRGYFTAAVRVPPPVFDDGRATLRVGIDEGPRARVGSVEFEGVDAGRLAHVRTAAALEPGATFLPGADGDARTRIGRWYEDLGFLSAEISWNRDIGADGTVVLRFAVSEGPQSVVTAVRVEGALSTDSGTIARAITLEPGAPAGAGAASATQNRLYGLGVFRSADVRFEPGLPGAALGAGRIPVEAVVSLSEAKRYQLRYGVQLSNAHGPFLEDIRSAFGVAADVRDRSFLGRGITLGGSGRYERNLQSARGLLFLPRAFDQRLESNVYATWRAERSTREDFAIEDGRQDVTLEQRLRVGRGIELSWGYSYYWRDIELSRARVLDTLTFGGTLASVQASISVDRRDNVFDAKRGWFHSQNIQFGVPSLGSDTPYTRYLVRQYVYVPAGPFVLASGVRWGTLGRVGASPPLTILDLFFDAGGSQTVRGYAQDALSSVKLLDVPVGGTDLLILNQEIRFPIFKWFTGAAFVDAGNTFARLSDISLSGLAVGAGFGLRIQTPLAPFRIDFAFPIGPFRESRFRWHFSIGQMF